MRPLNEQELSALRTLASEVGSDELRRQLLDDLNHSMVMEDNADGSRLLFYIQGYEHGPYHGQDTSRGSDVFPVEGEMKDADGGAIDVIIYVVDGRIYELELLRFDGDIVNPNWGTFRSKSVATGSL